MITHLVDKFGELVVLAWPWAKICQYIGNLYVAVDQDGGLGCSKSCIGLG